MNRKGFTLIEMLATIVILGIIMGIASYSVIGIINKSKNKTEGTFVKNIGTSIEEYISLKTNSLTIKQSIGNFNKCMVLDGDNCKCKKYQNPSDPESLCLEYFYESANIVQLNSITIKDLIDNGFLDEEKLVNPATKKKCFATASKKNLEIKLFRDSDYVYYYYINLKGNETNCEISNENGILDNMPNEVYTYLYTYLNSEG